MTNEIIQFATPNEFKEYELDEHEMILDIHMILCPDRVVTDIQHAYKQIKKAIKELRHENS